MLQELPREVLILISECLDQIQPRSVIDLACVNKNFFSVCAALLLQTLKFDVSDNEEHVAEEQLAEDVLHYSELLQRTNGFWMVRRLIIISSDEKKETFLIGPRLFKPRWKRPRMSVDDYRGPERKILHKYAGNPGRQPTYRAAADENNHLWKPLAEFLLRLPLVECIFYSGYYQFPPCLFDSLQQYQNQLRCRLYITRFALWSVKTNGTIDPYEFALLSSSSLHGIGTNSTYGHVSRPQWDHGLLDQALRYLVSGLTPSLKELVLITSGLFPNSPRLNSIPLPWIGLTSAPQPKHDRRGSLESLSIRGGIDLPHGRDTVEKWCQDTDVSVLKTLKITSWLELDAIEYMTKNCRFPSLTHLSLNFTSCRNRRQPSNDYYSAASLLLLNLPALSTLKLRGWHPEMATDSIISHHGIRLQRLVLSPAFRETVPLETLRHVSENCPFLEEINIETRLSSREARKVLKHKEVLKYTAIELMRLVLKPAENELA